MIMNNAGWVVVNPKLNELSENENIVLIIYPTFVGATWIVSNFSSRQRFNLSDTEVELMLQILYSLWHFEIDVMKVSVDDAWK